MIGTDTDNAERNNRVITARDILISWGPALVWMGAIFYASSVNTWTVIPGPPEVQALRKLAHVFEYSLLALLIGRGLLGTWTTGGAKVTRALMLRVWWVGALLSSLYAVTDEIHQGFVPRREFHFEDIAIDSLSSVAALGIWYIIYVKWNRRKAQKRAQP